MMTIMMMMMTKLMLMLKMLKMTMILIESFGFFFKDYNLHTLCNATLILDGQEPLMLGKKPAQTYTKHIHAIFIILATQAC